MRIIFTSVGRRVELIQAFKNAACKRNSEVLLYGVDMTQTAPALYFCNQSKTVCRITDKEYIPMLLEICSQEKIDALVPTIDTDLLILAKNKKLFENIGTKVMVPSEDKTAISCDKRYTADYFCSLGLHSPRTVDDVEKYVMGFPAFLKPKDGSSSINAYKISDEKELKTYSKRVNDYIIQPYINGTEYTVDIFCDYEGNPIYITPRVRLEVRAGEVLKTQICQKQEILDEIMVLVKDYKPSGAITVQLIRDEEKGINYYIEINPRFGGGAPLSIMAGADSADALMRLLEGEHLEYHDKAAEDGAVYSRFDQSVRIIS